MMEGLDKQMCMKRGGGGNRSGPCPGGKPEAEK